MFHFITFFRFSTSESESESLSLTYLLDAFFAFERSENVRAWSKMFEDFIWLFLLEHCTMQDVETGYKNEQQKKYREKKKKKLKYV